MNLDAVIDLVDRKLIENKNNPLNPTEKLVLEGIWDNKTYQQIAKESDYSPNYITCVVAPTLLGKISQLTGKDVTKKICTNVLESYATIELANQLQRGKISILERPSYPNGSVPLYSPFYIERAPLEAQIYTEITKPGTLVRIKAPREMGKTSLLMRVIDRAKTEKYRVVYLNLAQWDSAILNDLNKFLRCLCKRVAEELKLRSKLQEYWDEDIGSNVSCTLYFSQYLLQQINEPIILAIDELNLIFEYPEVAKDFLPLLRSWYEEAKRSPIWQNLRQIVVNSTEIYVPLHLKQSPFNVGLPISLNDFNLEQVEELARRYQLDWKDISPAKELMAMVGGHPLLIHVAIYHLKYQQISLSELLKNAPTLMGIYGDHLQRHQVTLTEEPELYRSLEQVIKADRPIEIEPINAYKLKSMGLIKLAANKAKIRCKLYEKYFRQIFNFYAK